MRIAFNQAFSDYDIPMYLSKSAFERKIIRKTNIKFQQSVGSYLDNRLVGFIFNTIDEYEGKKSAYNGGTGVIPEYRGNQLTFRMYEHLVPKFKDSGIQQCVLEVISTNKPAIRAYEKIGFKKSKYFHCLKMSRESSFLQKLGRCPYKIFKTDKPDWKKFEGFCDFPTSFLDTLPVLRKNQNHETILEARQDNDLIGFLIFNGSMGRIEHLGVNPEYRGSHVGSYLVKKAHTLCRKKPIYMLNINERYYDLLNFFLRLGFKNELDQFELLLAIK